MELENPSNGGSKAELGKLKDGGAPDPPQTHRSFEDIDSSCSTPYASAPSSPGRGPVSGGYFYSAPASPMHFVLSSPPYSASSAATEVSLSGSFEFDFSAKNPSAGAVAVGSMISADELFHNGQIRPMKLSSHLQRPQALAPLLDVDVEYEDEEEEGNEKGEAAVRGRELRMRSRSLHRRTRSLSPLRNSRFQWQDEEDGEGLEGEEGRKDLEMDLDLDRKQAEESAPPPSESASASSSRSSSSGRNSKKWIFLKDLLYRSKSEGRGKGKEKFWHSISFSPSSKDKSKPTPASPPSPPPPTPAPPKQKKSATSSPAPGSASSKRAGSSSKPTNGVGKRRVPAPSPHERHYTAKRAQAEEMRKRTFLPYRQGLLGCLGFSSRSYGAMNGFARALNPVSSR